MENRASKLDISWGLEGPASISNGKNEALLDTFQSSYRFHSGSNIYCNTTAKATQDCIKTGTSGKRAKEIVEYHTVMK